MTGARRHARIDGLYELAFRRHEAGEFAEAEQLYRSILEADPRQLDCLHFLGMIALQSGRPADAVELIGQAIAANDKIAAYHGSIAEPIAARPPRRGDRSLSQGGRDRSRYWAAHNMLADLLREAGDTRARSRTIRRPWWRSPTSPRRTHNLAALLLEQGRRNEALDAACARSRRRTREQPARCSSSAFATRRSFRASPEFRAPADARAGRSVGASGRACARRADVITANDTIRAAIAAINGVWPRRVHPNVIAPCMPPADAGCAAASRDGIDAGLRRGLERLLACVRTLLLDAALDPTATSRREMLPFACALARQCFINEYVFQLPDVERDGMVALRGKLMADLSGSKPVLAITLIAYACYAPLRTLDRAARSSARMARAMHGLLDQQLREPEEEARCAPRRRA